MCSLTSLASCFVLCVSRPCAQHLVVSRAEYRAPGSTTFHARACGMHGSGRRQKDRVGLWISGSRNRYSDCRTVARTNAERHHHPVSGSKIRRACVNLPHEDKHSNVDDANVAPRREESSHDASLSGVEDHAEGDEEGSGVQVDACKRSHNRCTWNPKRIHESELEDLASCNRGHG